MSSSILPGASAQALPAPLAPKVGGSMTTLIAWRNLAHDRVRLIVTLVGIVFSVVLMGMQAGLLLGFSRATTGLIDFAKADLWMVPKGTLDVDLGTPLDERRRFQALAIPGIQRAEPYLINFARWKKPSGGTESIQLVGTQVDRKSVV